MNSVPKLGRMTAALTGLLFVLSGLLALIAVNFAYHKPSPMRVPQEYFFREPEVGDQTHSVDSKEPVETDTLVIAPGSKTSADTRAAATGPDKPEQVCLEPLKN
jgi:hypothetical protein